jgi:membrane protein implicated in regulation of membrane protease activity
MKRYLDLLMRVAIRLQRFRRKGWVLIWTVCAVLFFLGMTLLPDLGALTTALLVFFIVGGGPVIAVWALGAALDFIMITVVIVLTLYLTARGVRRQLSARDKPSPPTAPAPVGTPPTDGQPGNP